LLHILLFDRSYVLTRWLDYSELRAEVQRRYISSAVVGFDTLFTRSAEASVLAQRLVNLEQDAGASRAFLLNAAAPHLSPATLDV